MPQGIDTSSACDCLGCSPRASTPVLRPVIHTRCAWLGAGASDIRPEHRHQGPATHTCCASHLPAEMAEMLWLECDCTPHCPQLSSSATHGGVVRKGCHLQDRQPITGNRPT